MSLSDQERQTIVSMEIEKAKTVHCFPTSLLCVKMPITTSSLRQQKRKLLHT